MNTPFLDLEIASGSRRISSAGALIGRSHDCVVRLDSKVVSARHAQITWDQAGWWIADCNSTNGTFIDGVRVRTRSPLLVGAHIELGDETLRVMKIGNTFAASSQRPRPTPTDTDSPVAHSPSDETLVYPVTLTSGVVKIGRDRSNDLVIPDRNVSRFHAELEVDQSVSVIRDLNSSNGTRLNGEFIQTAAVVSGGSEIRIGAARIIISEEGVREEPAAARLVAHRVQQHADHNKCILHPVTLEIRPGELVALIGEAGSGKSTLLKILAGETRPSAGFVEMDKETLSVQLSSIGYVPQADRLHRSLTAREALLYGARLRLPPDTGMPAVHEIVESTLRDLDLYECGDTPIGAGLSGGQQRRVAVGMELLGAPRMLFLDEPGTSLDIRLEGQLIGLLRRFTTRDCAVVSITHRTKFLDRFDRLLVMGRGGILRFDGHPSAALEHFAVRDFDDIYDRLADFQNPMSSRGANEGVADQSRVQLATGPPPDSIHQVRVLAARSLRVLSRDRRNLGLLIVQAPLLAAAAAFLFGRDAFALTSGNAGQSAQLLFVLAIIATWIGAITGARALVSERTIVARERSLGVRGLPYLMSKLLVLGSVGLLQSICMLTAAFVVAPLHADTTTYLVVSLLYALGTQVGLATGLLLSALAATEEQAGTLLLFLLVPQVLFAGAIVAIKNMGILQVVAAATSTRWILAGTGSALGLPARPSVDEGFLRYYGDFFNMPWGVSAMVLLLMFGLLVGVTIRCLDQRHENFASD